MVLKDNINGIWKDIPGYERIYQASNLGDIKSLNYNRTGKEQIIKQKLRNDGYMHVGLCRGGINKPYLVHRLVLETFVGPCPPGMECRHIDGNRQNNKFDNLKWGTHSENVCDSIFHGTHRTGNRKGIYNSMSKLNDWIIRIINRLLKDDYLTQKEIAKIFNVTPGVICNIKHKRTWKHVE